MTDPSNRSACFGILLVPGFPIYVLMLVIEALRLANKHLGASVYEWQIFTMDGGPTMASNGMMVTPGADIIQMEELGSLCILSGYEPEQAYTSDLLAKLRHLSRQGMRLGGIDTGAFILTKAGLLDDCQVTVHWEGLASFQESFPYHEVTNELFSISPTRFCCAGGAATLDLMLNLIAEDQGHALAQKVAQDFIHDNIRAASDDQRIAQDNQWLRYNPNLASLIKIMEENIEEPLSTSQLVNHSGCSKRQLQRIFKRDLGTTPMQHYLQIRLNKAQQLVKYSALPMRLIAVACGFSSMSTFSRSYRGSLGLTPRDHRSIYRRQASQSQPESALNMVLYN